MFPFPFAAGFFGVDQFRYGIEQMHPAEYLASRYYEHWVHTAEHHAASAGAIDPDEIERRTAHYLEHPDEPLPRHEEPRAAGVRRCRGEERGRRAPRVRRRAEVRGRRPGPRDRRQPARAHPQGALRPRQDRRGRPRARHVHLPRQRRQRPAATTRSTSTRSASTPRTCGATASATRTRRVYVDAWEPYLEPAEADMTEHPEPTSGVGIVPAHGGGDRRPGEGDRVDHDREGDHDDRGGRPVRRDLRARGRAAARRRRSWPRPGATGLQGAARGQRHRRRAPSWASAACRART